MSNIDCKNKDATILKVAPQFNNLKNKSQENRRIIGDKMRGLIQDD